MIFSQLKYICFIFVLMSLGCAELGFPCIVNCEKETEEVLSPKKEEKPSIKPITPAGTSTPADTSPTTSETTSAVPPEDYFTITNNLSGDDRVEIRKHDSSRVVRLSSGQCVKVHKSLHTNSITVVFHRDEQIYEICRPSTDEKHYTQDSFLDSDGIYHCNHGRGFGYGSVFNYKIESTDNLTVDTEAVPAQCSSTLK